jgi:Tfp pilus assembly protein PilF
MAMRPGRIHFRWTICCGVAVIAGCSGATTSAGQVAPGQPAPQPAQPGAKPAEPGAQELDAALRNIREGRTDLALSAIKQQAAKHPEWPPAQLILARLLFRADQAVAARRALEQSAVESPKYPDVYLTFGSLALGESRFSDARLNFENALQLAYSGPWDTERKRVFRREALAGLATVGESREDWSATRGYLTGWLELDPKNGQVRQRLARVLVRLGKEEDALAELKQAVKDAPSLDPAAVSMGWFYSQKGDSKKAEEWFATAQKLEPQNAKVLVARAAWLLDQSRGAQARQEIAEAVKLDPASLEARRLDALIAWHVRDLRAAEQALEPLHRDAPADFIVTNLLALTLVEQNDSAKRLRGLTLAEGNARQFPRSQETLATLGWSHYRAGHLDQAERLLQAAIAGTRTTPDIVYYLARVLAEKGQTDNARKLLQSAVGATGAFAHREDANNLLKTLKR